MQLTLGFIVLAATTSLSAASITVHSGNGSVGSADSAVHFLLGPASTDFAAAFTAANFTSARTGPFARIIAPNGAWVPASSIPGALWIGDNVNAASSSGNTDLYAISFTIPVAFSSASFAISYSVDNQLGGSNAPIYLNGTALVPSATPGTFSSVFSYSNPSVGASLTTGTNWLYLDAVNLGGPAGLLFSATITTVDAAGAPEPSTWMGLATGLAALAAFRRLGRA
jgi:hypothetical protein